MTKTNFFNTLKFEPSEKENTHLLAQDIAKTVLDILNFNGVITDITVRAQRLEIKKKIKKSIFLQISALKLKI